MRKILFRTSTIVTVLLLMVLACQKDNLHQTTTTENDDATSMSVAEAKTWFEANQQPVMAFKAGQLKDRKSVTLKPDWNQAFKSKDSLYEVVESLILTKGILSFATKEASGLYESTKNKNYLNSVSRLIVLKYKKDGRIVSFIMTVIGDKDYLEKKNFVMQGETYLKRDKELSGYVLYHSTEGEFVNGWMYKEGKVVGKVEITDNTAPKFNLKLMDTVIAITYYYDCSEEPCSSCPKDYYIQETCTGVYNVYISGVGVNGEGSIPCTNTPKTPDTSSTHQGTTNTNGGLYVPPPVPCNCFNICPICGKCKDSSVLKSADLGGCEVCTCPIIVDDPTFVGTKADCVKKKLENGSILNNLLGDFNLDASQIDITFRVGKIVDNGQCVYNLTTHCMDITINSTRLNASSLQLARTILHESFHAYIYGKLYDDKLHNGLVPEPNFENDFKEYEKKYTNEAQHNYIADDYIPYMKQALSDYLNAEPYNSRFLDIVQNNDNWYGTDFLYECLAWEGLQGTAAYASFMADPENSKKYNQTMELAKLLPQENCSHP